MKAGISLYSYGGNLRTGRMTVEDAMRHASSIGCRGIELIGEQHFPNYPNLRPYDVLHMKELADSLGLEIPCYSCYLFGLNRSDRETSFDEYVDVARNAIAIASLLGAKTFRPAYAVRTVDELVATFQAVLPELERYNVIWGAEIHAPRPIAFFTTAYERINSPYFQLIPDFSGWQQGPSENDYGGQTVQMLSDIASRSVHVHGKGYEWDADGKETSIPFDELLSALKTASYDGYVVAEFENGRLYGDELLRAIETHFRMLQKYAD